MAGMKDVTAIVGAVEHRVEADMYRCDPAYPISVTVGLPGRDALETNALTVHANNNAIRDWAHAHGCPTVTKTRVIGTSVSLIDKIIVPDEQTALRIVGRSLAARYRRTRDRHARLLAAFAIEPETAMRIASMLRDETDVDFDLLMQVAAYAKTHDTAGMTPRQVPLAGFSAKWLDRKKTKRRKAVELLCARELGLTERPRELRFRHLDPARVHEPNLVAVRPWSEGGALGIRYVVIVENKDTYQAMPPIDHGLCVFGSGKAAADGLTLLPWLFDERSAGIDVVYWGDMDAAGFEILSDIRQTGLDCASMFMDRAAYERYGRYGTNCDQKDKPLERQQPKPLPGLYPDERSLYESLCTGKGVEFLRLEQERIPIADAAAELQARGFPVKFMEVNTRKMVCDDDVSKRTGKDTIDGKVGEAHQGEESRTKSAAVYGT
ncbi:DUF2220 family protein [Bifidobacterium amazonense]|uniref:DUF2220 family protein n=1 Tax=Bifidobacterium amazonense TaxID=2809027 RepID=A0ABS9VWY6_9BIFI|nr:Wadjet anti-phage system protein JetD domain-containing protein [Bifidobacterium amazonense]MCH9276627.1 DUF2220 family protein [Bifidobacterium amazonense]